MNKCPNCGCPFCADKTEAIRKLNAEVKRLAKAKDEPCGATPCPARALPTSAFCAEHHAEAVKAGQR